MNDHMIDKKKWNALRTALLTLTALMLVMSAAMGSAWAYFTTYAKAKGGHVLSMGHEENVKESFANWNKKLEITATQDSNPIHVRARAFCAEFELSYSDETITEDGGTTVNKNWIIGSDGWVYYTKILPQKNENNEVQYTADPLYIRINDVPVYQLADLMDGDQFNVIIVYETTEVQYDSDGNPLDWDKVDWTKKTDTYRESATSSDASDTADTSEDSDTSDTSDSENVTGGEE